MTVSLETIDWHSFLARPSLPFPTPAALDKLRGARILVTGAGGSIGTALALCLAKLDPAILILLEASESNLFALQIALARNAPEAHVAFILGNINDRVLTDELFEIHSPQFVFHAAAFKHVPLLEEQPLAAIANNVFGTQSLASTALAHGARVVLLSTDKAVAPASIMGATKRVAEQIVLAAGGTVLRLGNVLASRDSVAEVFAANLASNRPLTVTDPAVRRYFVTMNEAVGLLLAAALAEPSLFAPALTTPHYIADFARFLARTLAPEHPVFIEFSRLRSGDKVVEQFWSATETPLAAQSNGLIPISSLRSCNLDSAIEKLRAALHARDLSAALALIALLVPDYTPSASLRALTDSRTTQAVR